MLKLLPVFLLLIIFSCNKSASTKYQPAEFAIIGKWTVSEQYISQGPPGEWKPAMPAGKTVEFNSDGIFVAAESFNPGADRFEILNDSTIRLTPSPFNGGNVYQYSFAEDGMLLTMTPLNPVCIEGCATRLRR